jgi:hypothetical protein
VTELFASRNLRADLEDSFRALVGHIAQIRPDEILSTADQVIIEELVREASADCPELELDQVNQLPVVELSEYLGEYGDGRPITRQVPRWTFVVPFTGDRQIFLSRSSEYYRTRPVALDVRENELEVCVDGRMEHDKIRGAYEAQIQKIQQHLDFAQVDCERHNAQLRADVPGLVRERRQQVEAMLATQEQVGFPIRHRGDTNKTPVPLTHVRLRRQKVGAASTPTPRWILQDSDYEEALRVLEYWRDSLERAPSIAEGRGEEEIRDLLVAGLNSVFQGAAAGEVFNGDGKTDILIRPDSVNVFVGECKIWDGESSMDEALDQLFRYAVWRDTKTAVVLFIRNMDVSAVIDKALNVIKRRENFVREATGTPASQYNFIMHATGSAAGDPDGVHAVRAPRQERPPGKKLARQPVSGTDLAARQPESAKIISRAIRRSLINRSKADGQTASDATFTGHGQAQAARYLVIVDHGQGTARTVGPNSARSSWPHGAPHARRGTA